MKTQKELFKDKSEIEDSVPLAVTTTSVDETQNENTKKANNATVKTDEEPIIKHIVISGGGAAGFSFLGVFKETFERKIWDYSNIKSIYATSVGTIIAFIIALNLDLEMVAQYFINRPWQNLIAINGNFLQYISNRGILGKTVFEKMLAPFFKLKDISPDITMEELYQHTGIEIHCFSTNMIDFSLTDFSYKTHPQWKMIDVMYCSSAVPVIFEPFFNGDDVYIDGAFICNYPIQQCYDQQKPDSVNEILGVNIIHFIHDKTTTESNLFDFLNNLIVSMMYKVRLKRPNLTPRHEILIPENTPLSNIITVIRDIEQRRFIFNIGKQTVQNMYK